MCRALARSYATGAIEGGHEVESIDIAHLDFPLLRTQSEFETDSVPAGLVHAQAAIRRADHLVFVFPLWLGTMPALLKAFLEQTIRPGFAFEYGTKGFPKKLLAGRSARLVVTMGMPAFFYRWYFMAHGVRGMERSILRFAGIAPVRTTLLGMVASTNDAIRKRWLEQLRREGRRAR